jgi:hypothetical protein
MIKLSKLILEKKLVNLSKVRWSDWANDKTDLSSYGYQYRFNSGKGGWTSYGGAITERNTWIKFINMTVDEAEIYKENGFSVRAISLSSGTSEISWKFKIEE